MYARPKTSLEFGLPVTAVAFVDCTTLVIDRLSVIVLKYQEIIFLRLLLSRNFVLINQVQGHVNVKSMLICEGAMSNKCLV